MFSWEQVGQVMELDEQKLEKERVKHRKQIQLVPVSALRRENETCLLLWESPGRTHGFLLPKSWHSGNMAQQQHPTKLGGYLCRHPPRSHLAPLQGLSNLASSCSLRAGHSLWAQIKAERKVMMVWCLCYSKDVCSLPKAKTGASSSLLGKDKAAVIS